MLDMATMSTNNPRSPSIWGKSPKPLSPSLPGYLQPYRDGFSRPERHRKSSQKTSQVVDVTRRFSP